MDEDAKAVDPLDRQERASLRALAERLVAVESPGTSMANAADILGALDTAERRVTRTHARVAALANRVERHMRLDRYLLQVADLSDRRRVDRLDLAHSEQGMVFRFGRVGADRYAHRGEFNDVPGWNVRTIGELAYAYRNGYPLTFEVLYSSGTSRKQWNSADDLDTPDHALAKFPAWLARDFDRTSSG